MNKKAPLFTTPPPPTLVQTWLLLSDNKDNNFHYSRKRAIDLLELMFGNLAIAQQYVDDNKIPEQTKNIA